jgi:glyoxylase-like metal-dependent hydrolase (beta-lactamase superfamily II)/rhodanese-related sulfurtransferase
MHIKQFEDKNLAHFSYAVLSECEKKIILIDPTRNPQQYLDFAEQHDATIVGVIETHPHADFTSSHLELHQRLGAVVYTSKLVHAHYPHQTFDEGDQIEVGKIKLYPLNTPGHSPDSISIVLEHEGKQKAVFTGDTLFIGDCGRPDLREGAGNIQATRNDLAKQMYHSLRDKLATLPDDVLVYPAHGAGTLCGKALSSAQSSTIGAENMTNWSMQDMTEAEFVDNLLADQPFIPAYFPYNVELNRTGLPAFEESISKVKIGEAIQNESGAQRLKKEIWIVDARPEKTYKQGHLPQSINLMEGTKFETWLGSIVKPGENFYLAADNQEQLLELIKRTAAIGYESQIEEAFVLTYGTQKDEEIDLTAFRNNTDKYTIVDVRNLSEVKEGKPFQNGINIPLADLRNKVNEIPTEKPIVVHCAGGYRSAAASSIVQSMLKDKVQVYDLSEAIKAFNNQDKQN